MFTIITRNFFLTFFLLICFWVNSYGNETLPNAFLLLQKTDVIFTKNHIEKKHRYKILINNPEGEKYNNIEIIYSRLVKVTGIEATLKTIDGTPIKKLKKEDIKDRMYFSDITFYDDFMVKEFSLTTNKYPYILDYSYLESSNQFLDIEYWIPVINESIPLLNGELNITVPKSEKIFTQNSETCHLSTDTTANEITYHWKASYLSKKVNKSLAVHPTEYLPWVRVVPENFRFEIAGSLKSWEDFGNWEYNILKNKNKLPDFETNKVNEIVSGLTDEKEKIRKLFHYLQDNTRYVAISVETGGLIPYPAGYVAENKYGDCKALANYFKSILETCGIKAYYTDIYAGNKIKCINNNFPSQQFNHVILTIPVKNDTLWVDCTSDYALGYTGTFIQGRKAFFIDNNNSHLISTKKLEAENVKENRVIFIKESAQSGAEINYNSILRGEKYEMIYSINKNCNPKDKTEIFRNYFIRNSENLLTYQISSPDRDSDFVDLKYKTTCKNIYRKYGDDYVVSPVPIADSYDFDSQIKQKIQFDFPVFRTDTQYIEINENFKILQVPEKITIRSDFGNYEFGFILNDNKIVVTKTYHIKAGVYTEDQCNDIYSFLKSISEKDKNINFLIGSNM